MEETFAAKIPFFAEDFQRLRKENIWTHESIRYVANCNYIGRFGYIVITSDRVICVCFGSTSTRFSLLPLDWGNYFTGRSLVKIPVDPYIMEIRYTPHPPFTKEELDARHVYEVPLINISGVEKHKDSEVSIEGRKFQVLPLELKGIGIGGEFWPPVLPKMLFFFDPDDGKRAYELLGAAATRGRIPLSPPPSQKTDIPELLQALAKLRDSGVITEQEFEKKKEELLSQI